MMQKKKTTMKLQVLNQFGDSLIANFFFFNQGIINENKLGKSERKDRE